MQPVVWAAWVIWASNRPFPDKFKQKGRIFRPFSVNALLLPLCCAIAGFYNQHMTSKKTKTVQTDKPVTSARSGRPDNENPFFLMRELLLKSLGRIPAGLTVLIISSLFVASVTGIFMQLTYVEPKPFEFLEQRLQPQEGAAPINPYVLEGTWVYQTADFAMSISMKNQAFEWLVRMSDEPTAVIYARGSYKIVGDVLILGLRGDMGRPFDKIVQSNTYIEMAMQNINLHATVGRTDMTWTIPVAEQIDVNTNIMHIFDKKTPAVFQWTRL